jgi:hypothetical protein
VRFYCVGLRAGSNSLKRALAQLGFPRVYSMGTTLLYYSHLRAWTLHATGRRQLDLRRLLARWDACKAHPAMFFPEDVLEAFPAARVILLEREDEAWLASYAAMRRSLRRLDRWLGGLARIGALTRLFRATTFAVYGDPERDPQATLAARRALHERVAALVPAERLLRFDVREGWEPLCAFLDRPVPNCPFPWTNRRQSAIKRAVSRALVRDGAWLGVAAAIVLLLGVSPVGIGLLVVEAGLFGLLYRHLRA